LKSACRRSSYEAVNHYHHYRKCLPGVIVTHISTKIVAGAWGYKILLSRPWEET
jgi:hypothetical protein